MKYNIIYMDPPWKYNKRTNKKTKFGGGAMGHYECMTMKDIAALSISEIAADNCALFMWTTFPKLKQQILLFDEWGIEYKTLGFSWTKLNKSGEGLFFGPGFYTASNSEVCLLGVRGRMTPVCNKVSSALLEPLRGHSRKPDEARERIVRLFGDVPRIEMFATEKADGWDSIGDEIDGKDIRDSLKEIISDNANS